MLTVPVNVNVPGPLTIIVVERVVVEATVTLSDPLQLLNDAPDDMVPLILYVPHVNDTLDAVYAFPAIVMLLAFVLFNVTVDDTLEAALVAVTVALPLPIVNVTDVPEVELKVPAVPL
jgi:hypothetical protein